MRRTFGRDVLACPRCGGRLRLIALIDDEAVIERILRHLGLPTEIPASQPARAPPLIKTCSFNQDQDIAVLDSYA
ncbi:MAG: ATP-dependent helicase HrpA [Acidobacteria bacterium]|nr:ATP-dependent helicase HrpA [Acidobacteriota bacterium]